MAISKLGSVSSSPGTTTCPGSSTNPGSITSPRSAEDKDEEIHGPAASFNMAPTKARKAAKKQIATVTPALLRSPLKTLVEDASYGDCFCPGRSGLQKTTRAATNEEVPKRQSIMVANSEQGGETLVGMIRSYNDQRMMQFGGMQPQGMMQQFGGVGGRSGPSQGVEGSSMTGSVKNYDVNKGYGFLNSPGFPADIYFKSSEPLQQGQQVAFTLRFTKDGKPQANNLSPCMKEHLSMAIGDGNSLQHGDEDESTATDVQMDICERLTAVEAALRLQLAAGTSHLQEIEMAPGAFGLSAAARPAIKAIRKRRNAALHVVGPGQDFDAERAKDTHRAEKLVSELDGKTVHEVIATGKEMLKSYGSTCDHSMDSSTGAISEITNFMQGSVHELVKNMRRSLAKAGEGSTVRGPFEWYVEP